MGDKIVLEIIVTGLMGAVVGILLAKYILITPIETTKSFDDNLKRYGFSGGFAIGTPVLAYFTLLREAQYKQESILSYFLALFAILIVFACFACWLIVKSVPRKLFPPEIIKPFHSYLIMKLLLEGYPVVKKSLKAVDNLFERCKTEESSDPQKLYEKIKESSTPAEKEILDVLKCTPEQFEHICTTIRKHYFDPH